MQTENGTTTTTANLVSRKRLWGGRVMSAVPALFLLFDSTMKLMALAPVREAHVRLGYPPGLARTLGLVELACAALYLFPRTAALGAILLTGWLGGAVATHVRVGDPLLSHVLAPIYVGVLIWGGLLLRDGRLGRGWLTAR